MARQTTECLLQFAVEAKIHSDDDPADKSLLQHADLLAAFREGDAAKAAQAMTEDVSQGMVQIRASL